MNIAIVHPKIGSNNRWTVDPLLLNRYDRIVSLHGESADNEKIVPLDRISLSNVLGERVWTDELASAIANNIRAPGATISAAEKDAYRAWLCGEFTAAWLGKWPALSAYLDKHAGARDTLTLISDQNLLKDTLTGYCARRRITLILLNATTPVCLTESKSPSTPQSQAPRSHVIAMASLLVCTAHRMGRFVIALFKRQGLIHNAWRNAREGESALRLLAAIKKENQPLVMVYIVSNVCRKIMGRCMRLLSDQGIQILCVDIRPDSTPEATQDYPTLTPKAIQGLSLHNPVDAATYPAVELLADSTWPDLLRDCYNTLAERIKTHPEGVFHNVSRPYHLVWSHLRPDAAIIAENSPFFALAARNANIPSVNIAHGYTHAFHRCYGFNVVALFGPDTIAEFNRTEKAPPDCKLLAVGSCRYDTLLRKEYPSSDTVRRNLGIDPGRHLICFGSTAYTADMNDADRTHGLQWLAQSLPPDSVLVVKKHPLENDNACESILSQSLASEHYIIATDTDCDLYGLLAASDVFVTLASTVAIEAILLNKPVIMIDTTDRNVLSFCQYGLVIPVNSATDMKTALDQCLAKGADAIVNFQSQRAEFIKNHLTSDDGHASERVAQAIVDLIDESKRLTA